MRSSSDAREVSDASRAAQTPDATWSKSTKMERRRCVWQNHDGHERRSDDGDQGQEHPKEQRKEAGSKDAEREAAGQEGQEIGGSPCYRWRADAFGVRRFSFSFLLVAGVSSLSH